MPGALHAPGCPAIVCAVQRGGWTSAWGLAGGRGLEVLGVGWQLWSWGGLQEPRGGPRQWPRDDRASWHPIAQIVRSAEGGKGELSCVCGPHFRCRPPVPAPVT